MNETKKPNKNYFTKKVLSTLGAVALGAAITYFAIKPNQPQVNESQSTELKDMFYSNTNNIYNKGNSTIVIGAPINVGNSANAVSHKNIDLVSDSIDVVVDDFLVKVTKK